MYKPPDETQACPYVIAHVEAVAQSLAAKLQSGEVGDTREAVADAVQELLANPAFAVSLRTAVRTRAKAVLRQSEAIDAKIQPADREQLLQAPWTVLNLQPRTRNVIQGLGLQTLGELVAKKPSEFTFLRNFGEVSLTDLQGELARIGLQLAAE